eukprot:TRINITY_DN107174_c0_g1_i1.p1 TRINITY_DN107174_c0_g1~~TRINITY_DN107174_c0_g1_i1.p1  ORF type:complete len:311 (+),score=37.89 TRINITY_DN107174_c0_g1_i1:104-934(+)
MVSHGPRDANIFKEYGLQLATGSIYGATNVIVGHPFDTVKTKMQAQSGYGSDSMRGAMRHIANSEGPIGFFRGCIPPMWGSACYRGAQFFVYDMLYNQLEDSERFRQPLDPLGVGCQMETRVLIAGFCGASSRTVLEAPIEYAKVKGQTGQKWRFREIYQGAHLQWARTGPMQTFYFCTFDACKRNGLTTTPLGQFICSGGAAMVGFWIVWPFETLKNQTQAGIGGSTMDKVRKLGFSGLYRGIIPGSMSVFFRNGAAMLVMQFVNRKITEWGLRS